MKQQSWDVIPPLPALAAVLCDPSSRLTGVGSHEGSAAEKDEGSSSSFSWPTQANPAILLARCERAT